MKSSLPHNTPEHEAGTHRLLTPATRIFTAAVILFTGAGVSAVFWKMPTSAGRYELCHADNVDKNLVSVPLPNQSVAALTTDEMDQIVLPAFDITPITDSGGEKYAQIYEAPASLVSLNMETTVEEPVWTAGPQKFEPMRQIVEEKPISLEPIDRDFLSKPVSVSTTEKSDELLQRFHFAENSRFEHSVSGQPTDPFAETIKSTALLQPLQPLQLASLSPLLPLQEDELMSLPTLTAK